MARKYLCISVASVAVECMFSVTGLILNSKRSSLAPWKLNYLSFIHDNYPVFSSDQLFPCVKWTWAFFLPFNLMLYYFFSSDFLPMIISSCVMLTVKFVFCLFMDFLPFNLIFNVVWLFLCYFLFIYLLFKSPFYLSVRWTLKPFFQSFTRGFQLFYSNVYSLLCLHDQLISNKVFLL